MKMILKPTKCAWAYCGVVLAILTMASGAKAQVLPDASEDFSLFGYVGQGVATVKNGLVVAPNACAPTAVANGLTFLQNYAKDTGQGNPFTAPQNTVAAVNALATAMQTEDNNVTYYTNAANRRLIYTSDNLAPADRPAQGTRLQVNVGGTLINVIAGPTILNEGGTTPDNIYKGVGAYLTTANPFLTTPGMPAVSYGQGFDPSASTLATLLKADDGVEVGVTWGTNNARTGRFVSTGGAHFLTLQSIDMTSATKGTVGLIDPWGATGAGGAPGDTANYVVANVTIQNGVLFISGNFGDDADTIGRGFVYGAGGQNASGIITLDDFQAIPTLVPGLTPVPEPSTYLAGALLLLPFGVSTLRKMRAARLPA